jgi:hypothetical protein
MTAREPTTTPAPTGATRSRAALSDPAPLVARAPRWPHPVIVTPLLAFAALAQWAMLRPAIPSDAISYFEWARTITDNPIGHGPTRLGVVVPVSAAIRVFGPSELAFHVIPVGMFLLLVLGVYLLGTQLFGQYVGVLAAVAVTTSTLVYEYSSHPLPDPFAAAWFVIALASLVSSGRCPPGWGRDWRRLLGALAVGLAYLAREYVVLLAPVVLVIVWRQRWPRRDILMALAVLAAVFALELLAMLVLFGDPLARIRAVAGFGGSDGASSVLAAYGAEATRWTVLARGPNAFRAYEVGTLMLWSSIAALPLAFLARRRDRPAWQLLAVWLVSLWLPMVLLAGLIDPSAPRIRDFHIRYWFLIVPAMFIAVAAVIRQLALWAAPRWRPLVAGLLVALLAAAAVQDLRAVPDTMRFRAFGATHPDELRTWFANEGEMVDVVWTDSRTARVLPLYTVSYRGRTVWDGEIAVFDGPDGIAPIEELDGAVVVYELGLRYLARRDVVLPERYGEPVPGWVIDVRRADDTLWIARRADDVG